MNITNESEPKQTTRAIKLSNGGINKKVEILARILYGTLPESELLTLLAVVECGVNNDLFITTDVSKHIKIKYGISHSSFTTGLFRLKEKGLIKKDGKTVTVHPIFTGVVDMNKFVVNFPD